MAAQCTEETKFPGDPQCASKTIIDDYLIDKYLYLYSIDPSANYNIQNYEIGDPKYII